MKQCQNISVEKKINNNKFFIKKIQDKLKWEFSRNGELFPHYYGNLETKCAENTYNLYLNADGIHEFPENFFS